MAKKRLVLALGHRALGENLPKQKAAIAATAKGIADLIQDDYQVLITHDNTAQLDMIHAAMNEFAQEHPEFTAAPMSVCSAMSQGYIGYDLQNAIQSELFKRKINQSIAALITQVVVDPTSDLYNESTYTPLKVIGRTMSADDAKLEESKGNSTVETHTGYRRIVDSPKPISILEMDAIHALLNAGQSVIAAGGGGIPVIKQGDELKGASAVIDKDLTAALLAKETNADILLYLTNVEDIVLNFGSHSEIHLNQLSIQDAKSHAKAGHFAAGAMLSKIQGALDFLETGSNRKVIITTVEKAKDALEGKAGTTIS